MSTQLEPAHVIFLRARSNKGFVPTMTFWNHGSDRYSRTARRIIKASARLIVLRARKRIHDINPDGSMTFDDVARLGRTPKIRAWWKKAADAERHAACNTED